MHVLKEKLRAPELRVTHWVNSAPLSLASLRGQVVLIDFWDYTCINCLHTLPTLKGWHQTYFQHGLTIIGIHAPEFSFAQEIALVSSAVERLDISYPVAIDNEFRTWKTFANHAWPGKYLIDHQGYIRAFRHGEGADAEFEELIRHLLVEANPILQLPTIWSAPDAKAFENIPAENSTPELYLGWGRGKLGNRPSGLFDQAGFYDVPQDEEKPDTIYLEGAWSSTKEWIEPFPETVSRIHLLYQAQKVNLVVAPSQEHPIYIRPLLDGDALPAEAWGADVALPKDQIVISHGPMIKVTDARMIEIISHAGLERHRLTLEVWEPGIRLYAFTFTGSESSSQPV